jgi:hypothetical protein
VSDLPWKEIEAAAVLNCTCGGKSICLLDLRRLLKKRKRTTDQNALLWALYSDVLQQGGSMLDGWDKNELLLFRRAISTAANKVELAIEKLSVGMK